MAKLWLALALFFCVSVHATLTIHIQSPWRDNPAYSGYTLYVYGGATGGYSATASNKMQEEADGWFSFTWEKNISDFSWESFSIRACAPGTDQNCNGGPYWSDASDKTLEFKMTETFGVEKELWYYTDSSNPSNYSKSFVAPGSKLVWFKSPWGNKALPKMIFGVDSVEMRFVFDDSLSCGWFYGALTPAMLSNNPLKNVYFERLHTPYLSKPSQGTFDISSALQSADTIFIDGMGESLTITSSFGMPGTCFDSSKTLHIYHPWRTNTTYRDSVLYISVGNNILNNPTATQQDEFPRWWKYEFSSDVVAKQEWSSPSAYFNIYRRQNEWPQVTYFKETERPLISDLFPKGVYEAWLFTAKDGKLDISFSPLEEKVIRLMSPWDNMSPSLLVNGDTVKMGPFSADTCGWYQASYYKHVSSWDVYFKQTFGFEYYSLAGAKDGDPISLDSILEMNDTIWVMPYPTLSSAPKFSTEFPGRLGVCPTLQISAMLLDWAGEAFADSIDVDFGGIYDGNSYTQVSVGDTSFQKCQGHVIGMVKDLLSEDGFPIRTDSLSYPWEQCSAAKEVEKWFIPVEVAKDNAGNIYTNATCRDIDLHLDEEGFWLADISENSEEGGFFPLDDFKYLDSAQTVMNPKFDWKESLVTSNGKMHNYSFAMKISAEFQYVKGQYFEFRGDDDVWVFINNRLVVDIGGCHSPVEGAVDLDSLGLVEGNTYPFHIFFSERNATGSNFKMRTSINLQTEKTYYPREIPKDDGTISYEIWQLLMDESLSCDISSVTKIDTVPAASVFLLSGGDLPSSGVTLLPGENYGGIFITETMSGFTIDTTAIVKTRKLPPGNYCLQFFLESDLKQSSKVYFTVPEYPLPTIAFADSLGNEISPDTVSLGQYAFVLYPVYVKILYYGELCLDCVVSLALSSSDSLSFYGENSIAVDSIKTDSSGFAKFYVMGNSAVEKASFKVFGSEVENELVWKNITLEKPPVPIPQLAEMHDKDGDGVGDSLVIVYNDALKSNDYTLDSLAWMFGDSLWHITAPASAVEKKISGDSSVVFTADSLYELRFTGDFEKPYQGNSKSHFTYVDSTGEKVPFPLLYPIADRVPPMISKAIVIPKGDKASLLSLYFTEAIDFEKSLDSLFSFRVWRDGIEISEQLNMLRKTPSQDGSSIEILFSQVDAKEVLPAVGDSIRFVPGNVFDLSENVSHKNNPWVRLEGEQRLRIEKSEVFVVSPDKIPNEKETISVHVVSTEKSFSAIEKEIGLPGQLIRFDLSELLLGEENVKPSDIKIKWEQGIFTNLGSYVNSDNGIVSCADKLFNGDCRKSPGLIYFAWNLKSASGRLAGSGAYISKMDLQIKKKNKTVTKNSSAHVFGIKREN